MVTLARSKQAGQRRLQVLYLDKRGWGSFRIFDNKGAKKDYAITPVAAEGDEWEAYLLDGPDAEYRTSLGSQGWSCTCPGFEHRQCCRHCDSLAKLREMKRI